MADKSELEQTHCVVSKVFAFTVPPLGSADGFKASLWPKQPIWVGRLRVVSRGSKCAVLLEHTDKDGLFASCPIQDSRTVEPAVDSSRYFVLRLSDGKGRHALIGIGFNDRAQAFDFKVSLQDYENQNREGGALVESGSKHDYSIPEGGSIHVNIGSSGEKKKKKSISSSGAMDVSTAMAGLKLEGEKEKKKKKKKDKETREGEPSFAPSATASSIVGSSSAQSSNIIDFGFNDFDPLSSGAKPAAASSAFPQQQRSQASMDPFAPDAAPSFGTNSTPFESVTQTSTLDIKVHPSMILCEKQDGESQPASAASPLTQPSSSLNTQSPPPTTPNAKSSSSPPALSVTASLSSSPASSSTPSSQPVDNEASIDLHAAGDSLSPEKKHQIFEKKKHSNYANMGALLKKRPIEDDEDDE